MRWPSQSAPYICSCCGPLVHIVARLVHPERAPVFSLTRVGPCTTRERKNPETRCDCWFQPQRSHTAAQQSSHTRTSIHAHPPSAPSTLPPASVGVTDAAHVR